MRIMSPAFGMNRPIPSRYACDGADVNPPLSIDNVPPGAGSLALIVDDPDAPGKTWVHWTLWNLDPAISAIPEDNVPEGAVQGANDFGKRKYGGPCPPGGVHHYHFRLFALADRPALPAGASRAALEDAMKGKVLAHADWVGTYRRQEGFR